MSQAIITVNLSRMKIARFGDSGKFRVRCFHAYILNDIFGGVKNYSLSESFSFSRMP
jgi:hypothetical protein